MQETCQHCRALDLVEQAYGAHGYMFNIGMYNAAHTPTLLCSHTHGKDKNGTVVTLLAVLEKIMSQEGKKNKIKSNFDEKELPVIGILEICGTSFLIPVQPVHLLRDTEPLGFSPPPFLPPSVFSPSGLQQFCCCSQSIINFPEI